MMQYQNTWTQDLEEGTRIDLDDLLLLLTYIAMKMLIPIKFTELLILLSSLVQNPLK